jgi:hypothetical protein
MVVNGITGTIRVFGLNQQASVDTKSLFANLESFVNMGESVDEYTAFTQKSPTFWPAEFGNAQGDVFAWGKDVDLYEITMVCRNYLRELWRGTGDTDHQSILLKILLGLGAEGDGRAHIPESIRFAQQVSLVKSARRVEHLTPGMGADWTRGEFSYRPLNDFQRAVFALWRESWRARVCRQCTRLFIADKPPQLYCSPGCSAAAKRAQSLDYYNDKGKARREKRRRKVRKGGGR